MNRCAYKNALCIIGYFPMLEEVPKVVQWTSFCSGLNVIYNLIVLGDWCKFIN